MRGVLLGCALACVLASYPQVSASASTVASAPTISAASPVFALQVPDKKIEITVGDRGGVAWYRSPVWIALGALAFIVLILLIVLLSRSGGGGTTIVRE